MSDSSQPIKPKTILRYITYYTERQISIFFIQSCDKYKPTVISYCKLLMNIVHLWFILVTQFFYEDNTHHSHRHSTSMCTFGHCILWILINYYRGKRNIKKCQSLSEICHSRRNVLYLVGANIELLYLRFISRKTKIKIIHDYFRF